MSEETPMSEGSGGFEVETGGELDGSIGTGRQPLAPKRDKRAERSANIKNTFGQGPGRIALFAISLILVVFMMIGIRSCTHKSAVVKSDAQVDVPGVPAADFQPLRRQAIQHRRSQIQNPITTRHPTSHRIGTDTSPVSLIRRGLISAI